ncbi:MULTISPECIES: hypothetical protein [Gammaproteobacteria]|uniref:hypothetical protein n=1 Tax=Gammaproteobacteria TaxID=1236 RepID=UPI0035640C0D
MNVTLPNGKVIEGVPEGTTKEQIKAKAIAGGLATAEDFGDLPSAPQAEPVSQLGALASSVGQGLTLGFSDELAGLFSPELKESMREYQQRAGEQYPVTTFLGDVGGAVLPAIAAAPFTAGGSLAAIPAAATRSAGQSALRRLGGLTATGAAVGGTAGAGYSGEEFGTRELAEDVGMGAAGGAVFGSLFPLVGKGVQKIAQKASEALPREKNVQSIAQRKILEALGRDKLTPEMALAELNRLGPDATLADIGQNLMGLTRGAAAQPGEARTIADALYRERSQGARGRITDALQTAFGKEENFYGELRGLEQQMSELASPAYDKAYQKFIPFSGELKDLARRPSIAKAIEQARLNAAEEGRELPVVVRNVDGKPIIDGVPDMRAWDDIKKGLDDVIDSGTDPVTGKLNADARRAVGTKRELVKVLDDLNPDYRDARSVFAGPKRNEIALREGRQFMREDSEVLAETLESMSDSEKAFFRSGAMRAMRDKILENQNPRAVIEKLERTGKLRAVVPDDEAYEEFVSALQREAKFQETANKIRGGSPTARIEAEMMDMKLDPGIVADISRGNLGQAAAGLARNISGRFQLPSERLRETIATPLMTRDPAMQQQVLQGLIGEASRTPRPAIASPLPYAAGTIGGLLGTEL